MSRAVDVNAPGRLQPVVSIEDDFRQRPFGDAAQRRASDPRDGVNGHNFPEVLASLRHGSAESRGVQGRTDRAAGSSDRRQQLETLCLRAERQGGGEAWAQVLPHIHECLQHTPGDAQAWVYLARAHVAKGKAGYDEAVRAADEALRLEPTMSLGYAIDALIARRCLKAREWDVAVRHAEAALASQPGDPECLEVLARALVAQDKHERAESALKALANTAPDRSAKLACSFAAEASVATSKGISGMSGSKPQQRHQWLTLAAAWTQGRDRPLKELGEVCLLLQRNDEAALWFQKAFTQNPDDVTVVSALAQLHVRAGCMEEAIDVYRIASRSLPDSYPVHRKLGQLLLQEQQPTEATEVIRRAARLAPPAESSGLYVALADLQQSMGFHTEALRAWEAAVALDESSITALRGLASCAGQPAVGNDRAQLRALSQLCRLEPANREWAAKLQQLRERGAEPAQASEPILAPVRAPPAVVPPASAPSANSTDWRDKLQEDQEMEVYSKSATKWIPSRVVQLSPEMVKLKYLIDGHWCEKVLLRTSEMLRPKQQDESEVGQAAARRAPEAAAREVEAASARAGYKSTQPTEAPQAPQAQRAGVQRIQEQAPAAPSTGSSATYSRPSKGVTPLPEPMPAKSPRQKPGPQVLQEPAHHRPPGSTSHPELLEANELQFGKVLGSGGFGAVYMGMYRGEEVAIKKLHPMDTGSISPQQMEEFKKEVANLQALRHERLVRFIGAAFVRPSLCLVLEFMANGSLYDLLHQRKEVLTKLQRFKMAVQIAEGVSFLHGRDPPFVHRDLKSLNVVLDLALNVKLCDFGLTQSMENTHISRKDNEGGSPRYMAPELFDSKGRITEKVDVWALGCLAIEVFTGRVPHEECNTIQQVMIKTLVNKQLPFLDWTGVSTEVRTLAEMCFVFDTRARIDAPRFLEGLRGFAGRL